MRKILFIIVVILFPFTTYSQNKKVYKHYAFWLAESEMKRFPEAYQLDHGTKLNFGYSQGLGCRAMLKMWNVTHDKKYFDYVEEWADTLINTDGSIIGYDISNYNIDYINAGKILFELYGHTKKEKYKYAMDLLISQLSTHPRTTDGGYWHKLIYPHQIWLDGIYMASPFMAQYGVDFNKKEWVDEAVKQITICHDHTFDAMTGLYYHAWDESKSQKWANTITGQSPNFWGRSIGWWFMAMVDALDYIPKNHEGYSRIKRYISDLAAALIKYQDDDGLWYQVIDKQKFPKNYTEASVNSQFLYAYAKAIKKGYVDKKYNNIVVKLFNGIRGNLIKENNDGSLSLIKCCAVGGLGGSPYRDGSYEYYIGEKIRDNDSKATAPFIMGCLILGI